jgi:hypothetical protein
MEWMLSVMVIWMGLFTNRRRDFSRFDISGKSGLLTMAFKMAILTPLRVLDALLTENSGQMPALICM